MLVVTEILSQKWESFSDQTTVIRCWLKADIPTREHQNALKAKVMRLDREDNEGTDTIDDLCGMITKMSLPASVTDSRPIPRVLTDRGLTERDVREAIKTWLSVEDDPGRNRLGAAGCRGGYNNADLDDGVSSD